MVVSVLGSKELFPIFVNKKKAGKPFIFLDSAATTHKPESVIQAITDFYSEEYATINRGMYASARDLTYKYENVRYKIQQFLNANDHNEIVFTRGATHALNMLAIALNDSFVPSGGTVLVSEVEHHANILSWEIACKRNKALVKTVRVDEEGFLDLNHLESLLKTDAKVLSIAHVSNVTGCIQDIKAIAAIVHRYQALLVVDGAQAVAHFPIDIQDLDADFYIFSSHKVYGPTGLGVLFGKYDLLKQLPPVEGGGDMIDIFHGVGKEHSYQAPPVKFEAGTPSLAGVIGFGAALDYLVPYGMEKIFHYESSLTSNMYDQLLTINNIKIIGPQQEKARGGLISFQVPGIHPMDLGLILDQKGTAVRTGHLCSQPAMSRWQLGHVVRVSFGIYNDLEDNDTFIRMLSESIERLS